MIADKFQKITASVAAIAADVAKADAGNHAAGVRVRKAMQQLKHDAQDVRLSLVAKAS